MKLLEAIEDEIRSVAEPLDFEMIRSRLTGSRLTGEEADGADWVESEVSFCLIVRGGVLGLVIIQMSLYGARQLTTIPTVLTECKDKRLRQNSILVI